MKKNNDMNYTNYFLNYWPEQKKDHLSLNVKLKNGLKYQHAMVKSVSKQFALSSGC
jgi:hypothetical protein